MFLELLQESGYSHGIMLAHETSLNHVIFCIMRIILEWLQF